MISIIVPVYNVEPYLRKCLDSILDQTYRDLEILIIDDGSTDGSGAICDEYAGKDDRIKVFHTENKGLSAARNLGLDNATGDWIGFIDSDDWIEPDMYEVLIKRAEETGADVVECGFIKDYQLSSEEVSAILRIASGADTLEALIIGEIQGTVWNKIWKKNLFNTNRFPEGQEFEDISTVYKAIQNASVTGVNVYSYHYTQRKDGISQNHSVKNLMDNWNSHRQRYEELKGTVSTEACEQLLNDCAYAIARTWVWYLKCEHIPKFIDSVSRFACSHYPIIGNSSWPIQLRICVFLARINHPFSYRLAYVINQIVRYLRPEKYY